MSTSNKYSGPWLLILILLAAGCADGNASGDGAKPDDSATANGGDPKGDDAKTPKDDGKKTPVASSRRTSLEGKWMLVLSQRGADFPIALIDVAKVDDALKVSLVEATAAYANMDLKSSEVDGDSLQLHFSIGDEDGALDIQGALSKGVVWGNSSFGGGRCDAARLFATKRKALGDAQPEGSTGREEFITALDADDTVESMSAFAKQFSDSPLALDAYEQVFTGAKKSGLNKEEVETIAAAYSKLAGRWGTRMQQMATINVGYHLATSRYLPEVALEFLTEAKGALTDETREDWEPLIKASQDRVKTEQARLMVVGDDEAKQAEGAKQLRETLVEDPFNAIILYTLANYAETQKQIDEAMELQARIAVLPTLETMLVSEWSNEQVDHPLPGETVARLWKEKHGDTEKLDEFLNEVYEKSINAFADKRTPARKVEGGNRIALVELFTGAQCPPCVAADVATGGLEKTFGKSDVIVLRYHQHIPGPDPFANPDSEARFFFYDGQGTPSVTVNGTAVVSPGGGLMQVSGLYDRLTEDIKPILEEKATVKLALTATAKDGKLTLSATATGFDPDATDGLKLRLVLAEDATFFHARNGIRLHEMLVRGMPGGSEGVPVADGELKYEETIDLGEFKQKLKTYLADYEREQGATFGDFKFSAKPLDMRKLHLVAFVQQEGSREVLQSAAIPVAGKIEFPAPKKPTEKKPPVKKDKGEKPKADTKPKSDG